MARETNVTIQKLTEWRDRALAGATSALKERERDDRDDEIARLKAKVGEITMDNELLYAKIDVLENKRPLARRRPRNEPGSFSVFRSHLWIVARDAGLGPVAGNRVSVSRGDA